MNNQSQQMSVVKNHFDSEADYYDNLIQKVIPFYYEMVQALVLAIPFEKTVQLEVCDLGCGTGTISKTVGDHFENAAITLVDMSAKMLELAAKKLTGFKNCTFIHADFYQFEFPKKYDAIVSSLALHHLVTDQDKIIFYEQIYEALKPNGVFINADVILGSNEQIQAQYMKKWFDFMAKKCTTEEMETCKMNYQKEDYPASLINHINWLTKVGFTDVDVIWKYYNFAVYGGRKYAN